MFNGSTRRLGRWRNSSNLFGVTNLIQCSKCLNEYEPYSKAKRRICRPCKQEYDRNYHKTRPSDSKVRKQEMQTTRMIENKTKVYQYLKDHPCVMCGESDPVVLEFDHIDQGTKDSPVSLMHYHAWDKIQVEIAKCRVLCANCHRRHTAVQMGWYKYLI